MSLVHIIRDNEREIGEHGKPRSLDLLNMHSLQFSAALIELVAEEVKRLRQEDVSLLSDAELIVLLERIDCSIDGAFLSKQLRRRIAGCLASDIQIVVKIARFFGVENEFWVDLCDEDDWLGQRSQLGEDLIAASVLIGLHRDASDIEVSAEVLCGREYSVGLFKSRCLAIEVLKMASHSTHRCEVVRGRKILRFCLFKLPTVAQGEVAPSIGPDMKATLITSMFNGKKYIPSFLKNLISLSNFNELNVLIFDAGPGQDDLSELREALATYQNISYVKLSRDPGLYDIWNLGIALAKTPYVGNANLDDRRQSRQLEDLCSALQFDEKLDVVSTRVVPIDDYELENFDFIDGDVVPYYSWLEGRYGPSDLWNTDENGKPCSQCVPHCAPLWRKSLHERFGFFNEIEYASAADFEFWLRVMSYNGQLQILPYASTFYYVNPTSYMRVDSKQNRVLDKLHAIYVERSLVKSDPYWPDFRSLFDCIRYRIN